MARLTSLLIATLSLAISLSVALSLPPVTGKYSIGTISISLTDYARLELLAPSATPRSFMIQLFYPSNKSKNYPLAPYASPKTAISFDTEFELPPGTVSSIKTNSHAGAPIIPCNDIPVIIFSHGYGASRVIYSTYYEDLASHGFLVLTIDHTYDASIVEFPDGQVIIANLPEEEDVEFMNDMMDVRVKDTQYVLDLLYNNLTESIPGVRRRLHVNGVGMFGHSFGGAAAANVMCNDSRVIGGMNLDGAMYGRAVETGAFDAPFVFMGTPEHNLHTDPTWSSLWGRLRGWKRAMVLKGSDHMTFSDFWVMAEAMGLLDGLDDVEGIINPTRAMDVMRVYIRGFFDFVLNGVEGCLLDGPRPEYPEMTFQS